MKTEHNNLYFFFLIVFFYFQFGFADERKLLQNYCKKKSGSSNTQLCIRQKADTKNNLSNDACKTKYRSDLTWELSQNNNYNIVTRIHIRNKRAAPWFACEGIKLSHSNYTQPNGSFYHENIHDIY